MGQGAVGRYGITVNSIPPGRIMSEQIRRNYPEEYRRSHAEAEIPAGNYGEPDDLAVLAVFLASPLAHYINGPSFRSVAGCGAMPFEALRCAPKPKGGSTARSPTANRP